MKVGTDEFLEFIAVVRRMHPAFGNTDPTGQVLANPITRGLDYLRSAQTAPRIKLIDLFKPPIAKDAMFRLLSRPRNERIDQSTLISVEPIERDCASAQVTVCFHLVHSHRPSRTLPGRRCSG